MDDRRTSRGAPARPVGRWSLAAVILGACALLPACTSAPPSPGGPRTWGLAGLGVPVTVAGSGPTVVLVNGGSMGLGQWDGMVPSLAGERRVVRFDLPGWGGADLPRSPYDPLAVIDALLDRLESERATLVGFSYGGGLALDYALARPDRVDALVLLAPAISGYPWSEPFRERHMQFRRIYDEQGADALIAATVDAPTFAPRTAADPALRTRLVGLMRDSAGLFALDPALVTPAPAAAWPRVGQLAMPALLVLFEHDDPEFLALGEALRAALPTLQVAGVPGVGHAGALEDPDGVLARLAPFLAAEAGR